MRLKIIVLALTVIANGFSATAQTIQAGPLKSQATKATRTENPKRLPVTKTNLLAEAGGFINTPSIGPKLLFLNAQDRVSSDEISEVSKTIFEYFRLSVAVAKGTSGDPMTQVTDALKDNNNAAVIIICDVKDQPSLLIAPENRWALVNVAALSNDSVASKTLSERSQKEIWRAFGYLMGAAHSNFQKCLLKSVLKPEDLDQLDTKNLSPEPLTKITLHAKKLGMTPSGKTTYREAVKEGWAPPPKDKDQQAIWDALKK